MKITETIEITEVLSGSIALFFLGQAGVYLKFSNGKTLFLDAYLSDSCFRLFGFKRMIPTVIRPEEVCADLFVSTHNHADHLDPDTLKVIAGNKRIHFVGAPDCEETYRKFCIQDGNYSILKRGQEKEISGIKLKAVYADHGDLAPDAIGLLLDYDGVKIYNAGDTAYTPEKIIASLNSNVDIMIAPINGAFGNMNGAEACRLAELVKPKVIIPAHFWMFVEHGGDPAKFLGEAKKLPSGIKPFVMAPGEKFVFASSLSGLEREFFITRSGEKRKR